MLIDPDDYKNGVYSGQISESAHRIFPGMIRKDKFQTLKELKQFVDYLIKIYGEKSLLIEIYSAGYDCETSDINAEIMLYKKESDKEYNERIERYTDNICKIYSSFMINELAKIIISNKGVNIVQIN